MDFLVDRRNILAVSNVSVADEPKPGLDASVFGVLYSSNWTFDLERGMTWQSNGWYCYNLWRSQLSSHGACRLSDAISRASTLELTIKDSNTTKTYKIDYCLSYKVPDIDECQLDFFLNIMLIVVVCNLTKVICMAFSISALDDSPLVLVGDAMASFLERRDNFTENHCLMEATDVGSGGETGQIWVPKSHFWLRSPTKASLLRWIAGCVISLFKARRKVLKRATL
jgi:hypothetical protein